MATTERKMRRGWESRLFMTVTEVATELGVDARTVHRAIEAGQITAIRLSEKTVRIPVATFLAEVAHIAPDSTNGPDATSEPLAEIRALTRVNGGDQHATPVA